MELSRMKKAQPNQSKITDKAVVCVVSLGYVGLPLVGALSREL
jgi:UDP-N-acetyl-D-mannosaminuronate dehydrogenase